VKIRFVTRNKHKFEEVSNVLQEYGIKVEQLCLDKPEVQAKSLSDVVRFSLILLYSVVGEPLVVEDTGLFIEALRGFPGVFSSYVFKTIGVNGILKLMENVSNRKAMFKSIVGYIDGSQIALFEGIVNGRITYEPRGNMGFGFDPIFIPDGSEKTFAEMSVNEKNKFSHRAKAFRKLASWLAQDKFKR